MRFKQAIIFCFVTILLGSISTLGISGCANLAQKQPETTIQSAPAQDEKVAAEAAIAEDSPKNPLKPAAPSLTLNYVDRFGIKDKEEGLREPSGLTISAARDSLWVVGDKADKIFELDLQGALRPDRAFPIFGSGPEGATLDPTGSILLVVLEGENEILKIDLDSQTITDRRLVAEMAGYDQVRAVFEQGGKNKGLEGITWDTDRDRLFVIKEGRPGLLLEIDPNLNTIYEYRLLNEKNGFVDEKVSGDDLDYSGLFYDAKRQLFWIVSDKGQRVFLYNWAADQVVQSFPLTYTHKGKSDEIEQAEGIAIDAATDRLYIVSDAEARLYVFDIQE